jgi:hypothetical protein
MSDAERIEELKRALEPFAAYAKLLHDPQFASDADVVVQSDDLCLTVGHFTTALRALMPKRSPAEFQPSQLLRRGETE